MKRQIEHQELERLQAENPAATVQDVWQLLDQGDLRLKMRQPERITAEAWRQDGVLTTVDLEWTLHISPGLIRELPEAYQERFGVPAAHGGHRAGHGRDADAQDDRGGAGPAGSFTEIARRIYHL